MRVRTVRVDFREIVLNTRADWEGLINRLANSGAWIGDVAEYRDCLRVLIPRPESYPCLAYAEEGALGGWVVRYELAAELRRKLLLLQLGS